MANNPNSIVISRNRSKSKPNANPKWPDFRGEAVVEGKTWEIALWIKERRADGSKFFSGSLTLKAPKATNEPAEAAAQPGNAFEAEDPAFT